MKTVGEPGPARRCQPFLDLTPLRCIFSIVFLKRHESVPVSTMWALKVSRSTIALHSRGLPRVRLTPEL